MSHGGLTIKHASPSTNHHSSAFIIIHHHSVVLNRIVHHFSFIHQLQPLPHSEVGPERQALEEDSDEAHAAWDCGTMKMAYSWDTERKDVVIECHQNPVRHDDWEWLLAIIYQYDWWSLMIDNDGWDWDCLIPFRGVDGSSFMMIDREQFLKPITCVSEYWLIMQDTNEEWPTSAPVLHLFWWSIPNQSGWFVGRAGKRQTADFSPKTSECQALG